MTPPALEFTCELNATLAAAIEIGHTPAGLRRIVTLTGGTFEGPLLRGTILPGGVDWQIFRGDGVAELDAHYVLKTDDGVLIRVRNCGLRHGPAEVLKRIAEGANVDPSEYYFRTTPEFEAPAGPYEWLNRSVFTATAHRKAGSVMVGIFRVH